MLWQSIVLKYSQPMRRWNKLTTEYNPLVGNLPTCDWIGLPPFTLSSKYKLCHAGTSSNICSPKPIIWTIFGCFIIIASNKWIILYLNPWFKTVESGAKKSYLPWIFNILLFSKFCYLQISETVFATVPKLKSGMQTIYSTILNYE